MTRSRFHPSFCPNNLHFYILRVTGPPLGLRWWALGPGHGPQTLPHPLTVLCLCAPQRVEPRDPGPLVNLS